MMHTPRLVPTSAGTTFVLLFCLLIGAVLLPGTPAAAQESPSDGDEWIWIGAGTALAGTLLFDEVIREAAAAEDGRVYTLSHLGDVLGRGRLIAAGLGGTYGIAKLAGHDEIAGPAGRILLAYAAAGVVNGALKFGVGRLRPRADGGAFEFRPLNLDNRWQSFPSGHTVAAFALATAISEEAGRPWVTGVAYGAATLTAWSRIHEDGHWTSDVVAGAIVGTLTSHTAIGWLRGRADRKEIGRGVRAGLSPRGFSITIPTR